jgi:hypothetical protein
MTLAQVANMFTGRAWHSLAHCFYRLWNNLQGRAGSGHRRHSRHEDGRGWNFLARAGKHGRAADAKGKDRRDGQMPRPTPLALRKGAWLLTRRIVQGDVHLSREQAINVLLEGCHLLITPRAILLKAVHDHAIDRLRNSKLRPHCRRRLHPFGLDLRDDT